MSDLKDPIGFIKKIKQLLDNFDPASEPTWNGSDNEKRATAIFQKLRDEGYLKNPGEETA
jgi:hypothetical protein